MTKDVDKYTGELKYIKDAVFTMHKNDLDNFEGDSKGSTGWFKFDIGFLNKNLQFIQNSSKNILKNMLKIKTQNCTKIYYNVQ